MWPLGSVMGWKWVLPGLHHGRSFGSEKQLVGKHDKKLLTSLEETEAGQREVDVVFGRFR